MYGGTTAYKAGVRFCSVTKAKPKVGQWWESAYVHGRTGAVVRRRSAAAPAGGRDTPARNPPGPAPD